MTEKNEEVLSQAAEPASPAKEQFEDSERTEGMFSELIVAIDGPSGSGKSSVSREVAKRLSLAFLDTGAMYRALTWWCLESGVNLEDEDAIIRAAQDMDLQMNTDPRRPGLMVSGVDIAEAIRERRISETVSAVAKVQGARDVLIARQRLEIESHGNRIVAEGRDITTVVVPEATARILLTASEEARMARRNEQVGGQLSEEDLKKEVSKRDRADSEVNNFTEAAEGVALIDSTDLDFEQTVQAVIKAVRDAAELKLREEAEQAASSSSEKVEGEDAPAQGSEDVQTAEERDEGQENLVEDTNG